MKNIVVGIISFIIFVGILIYVAFISKNEYVNLFAFFCGMFIMVAGLSYMMDGLEQNRKQYNKFKKFIESL